MKVFLKSCFLAVALATPVVLATTAGDLRSSAEDALRVPAPVSIVPAEIDSRHRGRVLIVEFVVTERGVPAEIVVRSAAPPDLEIPLKNALARWTFSPALDADGQPVRMKVMAPIRIGTARASLPLVAMK